MQTQIRGTTEFSPLTDSLASRIRWRLSDYEALLRAQVEALLDDEQSNQKDSPLAAHLTEMNGNDRNRPQ
jgi:hypothetical protein